MAHHWHPCCCQGCECVHCDTGLGPCCFVLTIAGIAAGSCGASCTTFNRTYYVAWKEACVWRCGLILLCDIDEVKVEIVQEGGDWLIRASLGPHVWEKNYGENMPACRDLEGVDLPHKTSSGECDSSSSTCTLTAQETCSCYECALCGEENHAAPDTIQLTINDVAGGPACCGDMNGQPFLLTFHDIIGGTCIWDYSCLLDWCLPDGLLKLEIQLSYGTAGLSEWRVLARFTWDYVIAWTKWVAAPVDCFSLDDHLPWDPDVLPWPPIGCDFRPSSAHIEIP
jgi:hypothetical protein